MKNKTAAIFCLVDTHSSCRSESTNKDLLCAENHIKPEEEEIAHHIALWKCFQLVFKSKCSGNILIKSLFRSITVLKGDTMCSTPGPCFSYWTLIE